MDPTNPDQPIFPEEIPAASLEFVKSHEAPKQASAQQARPQPAIAGDGGAAADENRIRKWLWAKFGDGVKG